MEEKLDYFDPLFIAGFIMAGLSDFAFLFMIGLAIPVIGQVLAVGIMGIHWLVGILLFFMVFFKLKHFVPKLILGLVVLLPLPLLVPGLILSIIAQNRLIELVLTQAVLAVTTAGVGNVAAGAVEGTAVAARGAQAVGAAARGAEAAAGAAEATKGAQVAGNITRGEKLRRRAERGLRAHEKSLKQELGLDEDEKGEDSVTEEDFGIVEATDKMKELFEPDYNGEEAPEEEFISPAENPAQEIKSNVAEERTEHSGPKVRIDENKNEVDLREAA